MADYETMLETVEQDTRGQVKQGELGETLYSNVVHGVGAVIIIGSLSPPGYLGAARSADGGEAGPGLLLEGYAFERGTGTLGMAKAAFAKAFRAAVGAETAALFTAGD